MDIPHTMKAMVLEKPENELKLKQLPVPEPGEKQLLVQVLACGVCRTDLHIIDGELTSPKLPLIPGHEIVGKVVKTGPGAMRFKTGDRVGIPWLGRTCGHCRFCLDQKENLCDAPLFTGYTVDGGFAEYTAADENYCFAVPDSLSDAEAAPLLCAGFIGYRSYRMIDESARSIGLYGFGAAAHILTQIACREGKKIYAFTRPGDIKAQNFARELGARWASGSEATPPEKLDAAIIFAPVGSLVPAALNVLKKGGELICGGIHMSDIPSFPYSLLWEERSIKSVANLQRRDGEELMQVAQKVPVKTRIIPFPLRKANDAVTLLKQGKVEGAVVLEI
ncbi:MAG: zinc-dependent alcohol dehydrogenase family protein [Spirochaetales bacterium]|nr:zinc-dependent alcohol dehydrogenase family protein [Spirochaetales bacterium]